MNKDLDQKLCESFPLLYADRHGDRRQTCMCWGFDCGDGWYDIIASLSAKLETEIRNLPEGERSSYRAAQVKEKFGGLRFYMTAGTDEMDVHIRAAESQSFKTCEVCGEPGVPGGKGWIRTLCPKCCETHRSEGKG